MLERGNPPVLDTGDRRFESCHPDQRTDCCWRKLEEVQDSTALKVGGELNQTYVWFSLPFGPPREQHKQTQAGVQGYAGRVVAAGTGNRATSRDRHRFGGRWIAVDNRILAIVR